MRYRNHVPKHRRAAIVLTIVLSAIVLSSSAAHATSYSWNVGSGDWSTPGNWSPSGPPGAADDAVISNGGTATLSGAATVTNFTLSSGAVGGSATLTVTGTTSWSGGSMIDSGTTDANGPLSISGSSNKAIGNGRSVNSNFGATWTGSGNITMGGGSLNIAMGTTFDVQNDQIIVWTGNSPAVNVSGTFQKSAGTGTTAVDCVAFNNNGSVDIQTGRLRATLGTSTGSFDVTGAALEFGSGSCGFTHGLSVAASITGGDVIFTSGTVNHAGSYSVSGTTVSGGTANLTGPGATLGATTLSSGTLRVSTTSASNASSLTQSGGTVAGSGTLAVSGPTSWSAGSMDETGTTDADGTLAISGASGKSIGNGRTINSNGGGTWTGSGNISMGGGVLNIAMGTTFDVQNDQSIASSGNSPVVNNAGTFQKSAGTGTTTVTCVAFNNTGSVDVQAGTLKIGQGTSTGAFDSTGATLLFDDGSCGFTHNLSAAASITGGNVTFNGGTVNHAGSYNVSGTTTASGGTTTLTGPGGTLGAVVVTNSATFRVSTSTASSASSLTQSGGVLGGSGTLAVSGTTSWSAGGMNDSGTTTANGSLAISGASGKSIGNLRTVNSNGGATWTGSGNISMGGGVLNIAMGTTFDVQNDQIIASSGNSPAVNNAGTFQKSAGTGTTTVTCVAFNNTGSVDVQAGTLKLGQGTSTGAFDSTGATLLFDDGSCGFTHNLSAAASITGGNVTFNGGTVNHAGSYNVSGTTTASGGTTTLTGPGGTLGAVVVTNGALFRVSTSTASSASSLTQTGGLFGGTGTLGVTGTTSWSGGNMIETATTNANGLLSINGAGGKALGNGHTLNSNGGATWTGSGNIGMDGGVLNIAIGTTFDVQNDQSFAWTGNAPAVNNGGTFQKSAGTGTTTIGNGVAFANTGIMQALVGTLAFDGTYTQTAGVTRLNGGSVTKTGTSMSIQGGTLEGTGTLTGNVTNSGGTLSPGLSPGQLSESGTYTQGASGAFNVEIGGLTVATEYDRAAITGAATLAGTLSINLINAYEPNVGDTFTIMTFGSHSGDFTTVTGTSIPNGKIFQKNTNATNVVLQVVLAPTPTATPTPTVTPTPTKTATPTSTLTLTPTPVPTSTAAAGNCGDPIVIPAAGGSFNGTNVGGLDETTPSCGSSSAERVYQWTPDVSGWAQVSTCGGVTNFSTIISVRSGNCAGTEETCASNNCGGSTNNFEVTAGQTYVITVDGFSGAQGNFTLTLTPPGTLLTPITGKKILIKDKPTDPTKRKIIFISKDPNLATGVDLDPFTYGATFQVFNANGGSDSACFSLPNWTFDGKYKDSTYTNGPCKTAKLKAGSLLKVVCLAKVQAIGYSLDEPTQGAVGVAFTAGPAGFCAEFGGLIKKDSGTDPPIPAGKGQFMAKDAPAPAMCPTPPASCP